ncbi:MAG: radical SAM protein [Pseudomonadota bacterium]
MTMNRNKILLVYPKVGMSGSFACHLPLSLLYAAADSIKAGFEVDIVDVRLCPQKWKEAISAKISSGTILAGLSVMTGTPIKNALEISRWIRSSYSHVKVVWGGPHAAFNGAEILRERSIDYVVSGYGSLPLSRIARFLRGDKDALQLEDISGLSYRKNGSIMSVPRENKFELINYKDIPYHLIEKDLGRYGQLDNGEIIFPMYSVVGCPYHCAFCSSPAQYRDFTNKYERISSQEVVDHIEFVKNGYGAEYIYFIDDDSFVNLEHVTKIIDEVNSRALKVRLGFRGARIDEIKKMDDEYLEKLVDVGTDILHVGAESGSQRMLDLIRKDITVDDIIFVNKKMARHSRIVTTYNWIVGLPGETEGDLRKTRELIMTLLGDNPTAIIVMPNKYRPLPGTELYEHALRHGYKKPARLEDWIDREAEGSWRMPWYTKETAKMIDMMQVTSFFIDDKIFKVRTGRTLKFLLARLVSWIYAPIARLRFKHGFSGMLVEHKLFQWSVSAFRK